MERMTMKQAYCRCNGGHYFVGATCPLDGWWTPASQELADVVQRLLAEGKEPEIALLREHGLSGAALERTVVIDFGSDRCVFEAIAPEGYIIGGKWVLLKDLDAAFL
jgi:hypothetical protein